MNIFDKLNAAAVAVCTFMAVLCWFFMPEPGLPEWLGWACIALVAVLAGTAALGNLYCSVRADWRSK